jgi:hypothetical protein
VVGCWGRPQSALDATVYRCGRVTAGQSRACALTSGGERTRGPEIDYLCEPPRLRGDIRDRQVRLARLDR